VQHTGGLAQRDTVSYAYDHDDPPSVPVRPRAGFVLRRNRRT
jgi:hypothetical protein